MRSSFAARDGFVLAKTPSHRQQQLRRRMAAISAVAGLALASGAVGFMTTQGEAGGKPHTGPFSYFPSE